MGELGYPSSGDRYTTRPVTRRPSAEDALARPIDLRYSSQREFDPPHRGSDVRGTSALYDDSDGRSSLSDARPRASQVLPPIDTRRSHGEHRKRSALDDLDSPRHSAGGWKDERKDERKEERKEERRERQLGSDTRPRDQSKESRVDDDLAQLGRRGSASHSPSHSHLSAVSKSKPRSPAHDEKHAAPMAPPVSTADVNLLSQAVACVYINMVDSRIWNEYTAVSVADVLERNHGQWQSRPGALPILADIRERRRDCEARIRAMPGPLSIPQSPRVDAK